MGNHEIALKNAKHPGFKREIIDSTCSAIGSEVTDADQLMASIQAHMVFPGIVIGSENNCQNAKGQGLISVSVRHIACENPDCHHFPILDMKKFVANTSDLDAASDWIYQKWAIEGNKIYLHCFHGIERAPLTLAYMIKRHVLPGFPFHNIYRWVQTKRPMAQDRSHWLEKEVQEEFGI